MDKNIGQKRLSPKFWFHDWYPLISLRNALEKMIKSYNLAEEGHKVLDIGCGDRPYQPLFLSKGCEYIGCDIDGNADIIIDINQPINLPDNYCDVIVSFQVLEHVWDLDWYLGECYRLLKPNGLLLLSTHGNWLYHPHPTDYRRWTREGLIGEINSRGLKIEKVISLMGPLAWTTQFRLLGYYMVLNKLGFFGRLLLIPLASFMNLRILLEERVTPLEIKETNAAIYVTLSRKC